MAKIISYGFKINKILATKHILRHQIILPNIRKPHVLFNVLYKEFSNQEKLGRTNETFGKIVNLTDGDFGNEESELCHNDNVKKNDTLKIKKLERGSKIFSAYLVNVKSRKKREKSGLILLEGKRLIEDALNAGVKPIAIFFSRISDVKGFPIKDLDVQLYSTSYNDLQFWSDVSTTQGVLAIFNAPDTAQQVSKGKLPFSIICDNVRDPGNMGSIIRTAAAVGCQQLFLTKGCVDIWDPKVLRSGCGSHFRLCIHQSMSWEQIRRHVSPSCKLLLADSNVPEAHHEMDDNEVSVYELDEDGLKIPISNEPVKRVTAYQKMTASGHSLPMKLYSEINYLQPKSLALIVGGETEGISEPAYAFAVERQGERVYLPLDNGVESLNSGTALGVVAYEIRRQRFLT